MAIDVDGPTRGRPGPWPGPGLRHGSLGEGDRMSAPEPQPVGIARRTALALAAVQFCFVTCWTVYVVYLPQLAAQLGIPREKVIWILLLDQVIFAVMDLVMGLAADRVRKALGRIGPALVLVTLVSCLAFAALPHVATAHAMAMPLAVAALVVWTATSSALRAPPWLLLARHAAQPRMPLLSAMHLLGLGLAASVGPYLSVELRGIDPRLPFATISIVLAAATMALVLVERRQGTDPSAPDAASSPRDGRPFPPPPTGAFVLACGLAGLAVQVHLFVGSGPAYLRFVPPDALERYLPLFWLGFNLAMFLGTGLVNRLGVARVMTGAAVVAALATAGASSAAHLAGLVGAQIAAGGAWGCFLLAAFVAATRFGQGGRTGWMIGLLWSALSTATLLRMALVGLELHRNAAVGWSAVLLLLASAAVLLVLFARSRSARSAVDVAA